MYLHICTCVYMCVCVHMGSCVHAHMFVCACACISMYAHVCAHMGLHMGVYTCVCARKEACAHMYTSVSMCVYVHMRVFTCMCVYIHILLVLFLWRTLIQLQTEATELLRAPRLQPRNTNRALCPSAMLPVTDSWATAKPSQRRTKHSVLPSTRVTHLHPERRGKLIP